LIASIVENEAGVRRRDLRTELQVLIHIALLKVSNLILAICVREDIHGRVEERGRVVVQNGAVGTAKGARPCDGVALSTAAELVEVGELLPRAVGVRPEVGRPVPV
jgi:hypothetical protein